VIIAVMLSMTWALSWLKEVEPQHQPVVGMKASRELRRAVARVDGPMHGSPVRAKHESPSSEKPGLRKLAVDLAPVVDRDHEHDEAVRFNSIDDSPVADSDAKCSWKVGQCLDTVRPRIVAKLLGCCLDALLDLPVEPPHLPPSKLGRS
jgi:hypothetical protein